MEEFDLEESTFEDQHLLKLFETAKKKINQGRTKEALQFFVQNLQFHSNLYGDSLEAIQAVKKILKLCINKALILFFHGEPAKNKMTQSQLLGDPLFSERAEIFHFLSILYKKMGGVEESKE